jgi:hypothetical protein
MFPLTFSFYQSRTDDLFWKAWENSFIFSHLKKLKAADGGKKLKRILLSSHAWLDKR